MRGFAEFFIATFSMLYILSCCIVATNFYMKRRLCKLQNCTFYIFSLGILIMGIMGLRYTDEALTAHLEDFSYSCSQLAIEDGVPSDSFLAQAN